MKQTDALRDTLESLSRVYHGDKTVPVKFGIPSRPVPAGGQIDERIVDEDTVIINPNVNEELGLSLDGAQELRCIVNTLSHEIEHIRENEFPSRREFGEAYPDYKHFAEAVIGILEDQYIDYQRTRRYPGLRKAQVFVVDLLMEQDHLRPPVDDIETPTKAIEESLLQVSLAGYAKGINDADDGLRECIARCRPKIDAARREADQERRVELAHEIMDIVLEYVPEGKDLEVPDTCNVCGERPPDIVVPLLGGVCHHCAPSAHVPEGGNTSGEQIQSDQPKPERTQEQGNDSQTGDSESEPEDCYESGNTSEDRKDSQEREVSEDGNEHADNDNFDDTDPADSGGSSDADILPYDHNGDDIDDRSFDDSGDEHDNTERKDIDSESPPEITDPQAPDCDGHSTFDADVDDQLDELDELDDTCDPTDWNGVSDETEYEEVDDTFERRFNDIQQQIEKADTPLNKCLRWRNEHIGDNRARVIDVKNGGSHSLWETEEFKQLRDDVQKVFEQFKTGERPSPSRQGNSVDMQRVVQRAAGDKSQTKLFRRDRRSAHGGRVVGLSVDYSNSMNLRNCRTAIAAVAEAVETIGDNFVATNWSGKNNDLGHSRGDHNLGVITGPDESFEYDHLSAHNTNASTPLATGIDWTRNILNGVTAREKVMIVVTDSKTNEPFIDENECKPLAGTDGEQAAQVVEQAQRDGIQVIGLGFDSADEDYMAEIFGPRSYVMTSDESLAEDLVKVYERQLRVS